jgi:hypothetical protein
MRGRKAAQGPPLHADSRFDPEPGFARLLDDAGLGDFDAWWRLDMPTVEPGNERRGGWSAVVRHTLRAPDGAPLGVYVKRQQDHVYRSWRHPWRGRLTGEREMRVLRQCRALGISTAQPVLYAQRRADGHVQGVLVTRELAGYRALADLVLDWQRAGPPPRRQRRRLLQAIATQVRALHDARIEHNCLYPKHLMISLAWLAGDGGPAVALIDLEKCKQRWRRLTCTLRDLDSLNRRSVGWSRTDRRRFLGWYLGVGPRLSRRDRRLWKTLARRAAASARQSADSASSTA